MSKWFRLFIILLCVALLVAVRAFEIDLFYDPFIIYFKGDYHSGILPECHYFKLLASTTLRYLINTLLSLVILFMIFKNVEIVRFSGWLYLVFFVVLITAYSLLYHTMEGNSQLLSLFFYIRRFIIQPIFLLLLLPGFYFFKKINSQ
ncbi:MAG TPA: exosortase F system-associated protein [Flavobacteriaceae bacterium]|nr:exosortase F system-associated protein [Flavobacteriaceae bacterium]